MNWVRGDVTSGSYSGIAEWGVVQMALVGGIPSACLLASHLVVFLGGFKNQNVSRFSVWFDTCTQ